MYGYLHYVQVSFGSLGQCSAIGGVAICSGNTRPQCCATLQLRCVCVRCVSLCGTAGRAVGSQQSGFPVHQTEGLYLSLIA